MASKVYDIVAVVGRKKDDTPVFKNIGAVFDTPKGLRAKIDLVPCAGWDGWVGLYEPKPQEERPRQQPSDYPQASHAGAPAGLGGLLRLRSA